MKLLVTLALCGVALGFPFSGQTDVVDVGYAKYLGNRSYVNTVAYLGIPYAEPPLGERRFRAPLALNTTRVRVQTGGALVNATTYPIFCIQGTIGCARLSFPVHMPMGSCRYPQLGMPEARAMKTVSRSTYTLPRELRKALIVSLHAADSTGLGQ